MVRGGYRRGSLKLSVEKHPNYCDTILWQNLHGKCLAFISLQSSLLFYTTSFVQDGKSGASLGDTGANPGCAS